jgi:CheY-like chemotaxis protein
LATLPGREPEDRTVPKPEFDAILMDVQMPIMDGFEATRRIRAAGYRGPVVALTAYASQDDRQQCLDAGCDDFLPKPIEVKSLLQLLARYPRLRPRPAEPTRPRPVVGPLPC